MNVKRDNINWDDWTPFIDAPWSEDQRASFLLFTKWHQALKQLPFTGKGSDEIKRLFAHEADIFELRGETKLLPGMLCQQIFEQIDKHALPVEWFSAQLKSAHNYYGPLRFPTGTDLKQFLQESIVPHGYLIARLADVAHRWQLPQVSDLATAFFLIKRLIHVKEDLAKDRLYIPLSDLELTGLSVEELEQGKNNKEAQKMLWKQVIRIRDAFAQGQPLVRELPRKFRRSFKKNWLTGLELVSEIEQRNFDLWSAPITLSARQQFQINVLSVIGKGAGKARGR